MTPSYNYWCNGAERREVCEREQFRASCPTAGEVLLVTHAQFGRMREGRCVTSAYGVMGCSADVRPLLDRACSGRATCELNVGSLVPERDQPCPTDFRGYLEVSWHCVKGGPLLTLLYLRQGWADTHAIIALCFTLICCL